MICPKCAYARKPNETVPDTQCPACGVFYAKAEAAQAFQPRVIVYEDKPRASPLGKIAIAVIAAAGVFTAWPYVKPQNSRVELLAPDGRTPLREMDFSRARITMHSLTTCVYCEALRRQFEANGVPFREVVMDKDPAGQDEMFAKLKASGFQGGGVGTPTLEVNGKMMPNNPKIKDIITEALGNKPRRRS